jgi:3alpha(or 20beta)-hydroxysteroid dehydrogenase
MSNAGHVSGKVAVVTGGARGMGAAHVRALARQGAIVAATDIIDDLGASLTEQLQSEGRDVSCYHHDVTSSAGWEAVVARSVQQAHGPIDVLVNNAGVQVRLMGNRS